MDQTQLLTWDSEEEQREEELRDSDREPRGRLKVFGGSQRPETGFMVYEGENVIGRHESCHIRIPMQSVSKKHAVIEIDGDSHLIHDCNSLNKTRRKNAILKPNIRYAINDGDLFLFADVACQYVLLPPPPAKGDDSGSETGSESMFPQSRPGMGNDRQGSWLESDRVSGDDIIPKAAGRDLELSEDSLMLLPSQPYQSKSLMPLQSDTYVRESEDDDTPWKGTRSFASRDSRLPKSSICQTPSANVVPESDDEGGESSRSNNQSMQLHYDSDTDLEEDQQPDEKWTEPSTEQPVDGNSVNSKTGSVEEQQADNPLPMTGVAAINHLNAAQEMVIPGEAFDCDSGRVSSQVPGAPPPADLSHFSRDNDSEEEEEEQKSVLSRGSFTARGEMDSSLAKGANIREADAATGARSLIPPGEEEKSSKADYCADSNADADGEAEDTAGSVDKRELVEVNSDTDIDDDTESYALQPTQCFTVTISNTQDETAGEGNYTPDAVIAAGANTEGEPTQLLACQSPTFNKEPFKDGTAAVSNTEEEATQLFTFQSPTFGKDTFESNSAAASKTEEEATQPFTFQSPKFSKDTFNSNTAAANNTEEEATQPFIFQSPTFSKDTFKKPFTSGFDQGNQLGKAKANTAAASSTEEEATQPFMADAVTLSPVAAAPQQWDLSESDQEEPAASNHEDQWAGEETQPFCFQDQAAESTVEAEEAEDTIPILRAEDCLAPTSQDPPKTRRRSLTEDTPEEESSMDPAAATDQVEAAKGQGRGRSQQVNEEVNSLAAADQQPAEASGEVNGEASGDTKTAPVQETGHPPSNSDKEAAGPDTEALSSQNLAPNAAPSRTKSRRGRRRPSAVEAETSGGCRDHLAIPREKSQQEKSRSTGAGEPRDRDSCEDAQRLCRNAPEPSSEAAGEVAAVPVSVTQAGPRRGRGRPKSVSMSTTDNDRCPPEEESPQVPVVRGRRRKGRSVAAPESRAENVEDTPQTDGSSQRRPAGRGKRRSVAAPENRAESVADAPQTDGPSQRRPAGRGKRRSVAAPESRAESVEDAPQTDGPSQRRPAGRGKRRSVAAPESRAESVEDAPQTDGPSQRRPAGRGKRRSVAALESQAESVNDAAQTDDSSRRGPAGRAKRKSVAEPESQAESVNDAVQTNDSSQRRQAGRAKRKSVAEPESQAESVNDAAQIDDSSRRGPAGRAKRKSVAEPESQAECVNDTVQTNSSSQRPAGKSRRKQECAQPSSQETGLLSGQKRCILAASPSDSEKETCTPPQVKTRHRACRLSSHSSSGSLPDSGTPPKIMFTGLVDENGVKVIKQLGGEVVESVHDSTHLVTDRIRRTVKFLCAVARGIPVVTPEWLKKCGKSSCFLSTSSFLVNDSDQEQKFNFKLAKSLQKAKEQPLLQDYRVHMTSGVQPDPSQMETIVQCSGATVLPKMPRAYKEKTLVISCPDDLPKCKPARDAGVPIVNAEFILTGILQQTVDLESYRLDGDSDEVVDSKPEGRGKKRSSTTAAMQPAGGRKKKR
ncbi:mediator of DNA damage checkpoint protein 1 isoform X3 [Heterodontus francisci]|uniref:mediator of DNA damage checkpoint protein 1 isoform X3 n=1 Tax=Heterodontus francisci TaxID=7792 RepID=UPI00355C742E